MKGSQGGPAGGRGLLLLCLGAILLLAGCAATVPPAGQGGRTADTSTVPSYMVHVEGKDHGTVLLVGSSACPWCMKTKALLANLSVDYYWVDLKTLDEANTTRVMDAVRVCGQVNSIPVLMINNRPPCIIGFQEDQIREALG